MKITKQDIDALIDKELNAEDAYFALKELNKSPEVKAYFLKVKKQNQALKDWWAERNDL